MMARMGDQNLARSDGASSVRSVNFTFRMQQKYGAYFRLHSKFVTAPFEPGSGVGGLGKFKNNSVVSQS
jgi:hypothetical protein